MIFKWICSLLVCILYARTVLAFPSVSKRDDIPPAPQETKYFYEPGGDDILGHYDIRYYNGVVSHGERMDTLAHMIRAYLLFFRKEGLETWIAHGTLLGWWWNGKMLPWDWDVDTQVNTETLFALADNYNQTVYKYVSEDEKTKRDFLLDVNPFSKYRYRGQGLNIIDARWIDVRNGLYIDITGVSELHPNTEPGVLACKNNHKYKPTELYPMRESIYEGVPAMIPYKYHELLVKEYGKESLTRTEYEDHDWIPQIGEWVPNAEKIAETQRKLEEAKMENQKQLKI